MLTAPSGWSKVASADSKNVLHEAVYMHRCSSLCSAGRLFTSKLSKAGSASGSLAGYRGVSAATPVDMAAALVNNLSMASTAPSVTTTVAGHRIVLLHGSASASGVTAATGKTSRASSTDETGAYRSSKGVSDDKLAAGGYDCRAHRQARRRSDQRRDHIALRGA